MQSLIAGSASVSVTGTGSTILNFLLGFVILIGIVWFINTGGFNLKKRYLLKHGVPVDAKVEEIEKTMFNVGQGMSSRPVMKMTLSFEDAYKNKHEVTIRHAFSSDTPIPDEGGQLSILIDSRNPERIMIAPASA
jgi:hypothetical protein